MNIESALASTLRALYRQQAALNLIYEKMAEPEFNHVQSYDDIKVALDEAESLINRAVENLLGD